MTTYSELWGEAGERWSPQSRLPDFSYAGYHCGEAPLPTVAPGVSVLTFGAKGDGETDDTAAFRAALATVNGAIEVPPGRYRITDTLEINRSGVVLRGAGTDRSVLFFPTPLQEIHPDWSATTEGRPTSNYSWAGGFVWLKGDFDQTDLTPITTEAGRGDTAVQIASTDGLSVGQRIEIFVEDIPEDSLAIALYSGDPGPTSKLRGSTQARLVCQIVEIQGDWITFDRPLRFPLHPEWQPRIRRFATTVTESGVENLCFEFPVTPYEGHFTELGYNPIAMRGVCDCWVRDIRIVNADSGLFPNGCFCTIQDVVFESTRPVDAELQCTGHHGIYIGGDDNLFIGFDFRTRFVHDITVSRCGGNVIAHGQGVDLCFDHHKRAPYENLFTDLDAGAGTRLWRCGGGADLGKNCAAHGTFWNIRAQASLSYPPASFGPPSLNLVAVQTQEPAVMEPDGRWFEVIPSDMLAPQNLHTAQLKRRITGLVH